jgi:hypothetical protein
MFHRVLAAALAIGAAGGASVAIAESALSPKPVAAVHGTHRAVDSAPCLDTTFRVYFEGDSAALDDGAEPVLDTVAARVAGCGPLDLTVGADRANAETSLRRTAQRTAAVTTALRARGVEGEVDVAPLRDASAMGVPNPGPAYIEVVVVPSETTLISENAAERSLR